MKKQKILIYLFIGTSHAEEVSQQIPTTVVLASLKMTKID